jgi:hypothetical protein
MGVDPSGEQEEGEDALDSKKREKPDAGGGRVAYPLFFLNELLVLC